MEVRIVWKFHPEVTTEAVEAIVRDWMGLAGKSFSHITASQDDVGPTIEVVEEVGKMSLAEYTELVRAELKDRVGRNRVRGWGHLPGPKTPPSIPPQAA